MDVRNVLVEIKESHSGKTYQFRNDNRKYSGMFEYPSWVRESYGEPNWCEFMLWESAKHSFYPMMLTYKYYKDPENDREVERRMAYQRRE